MSWVNLGKEKKMKIYRSSVVPENEMMIVKDMDMLVHNIVDSELKEKDKEIDRLNNIIDDALGIANERINYYNHKQIEAEDWSEIFNILVKRDNQELKGREIAK